ncbi:MAG: TonB-dependent receptor [Gammaproteobacteria bacterium]
MSASHGPTHSRIDASVRLAIAAAMACSAFDVALAQDAATPRTSDEFGLDEVVVSAERREESAQHVPSAVSVISGADVTARDIRNARDIIRFVPNMNADTSDGHMRPKWYIRGIGRSDASLQAVSQVGIYYDDVYIQNASSVGFPLFDLERVEVLRGPQGTLWGKNTIGGAVNFISKKPSFNTDGYAKLSYGNYHESLAEGAVGTALIDDVLAVRASGFWQKSDTYIQNSFLPGTDTWDEKAGRLQFLGKLGDSATGILNLHYRKFGGPVLRSFDTTNPNQTDDDVPSLVNATDEFEQKGATLTLNKSLGQGITLASISAFDKFDREQSGGDQVPYESARTAGGFAIQQFSEEVRLASPTEQRFTWLGGLHYFNESLDSLALNANLPGSRTPTGAARATSFRSQQFSLDTESYAAFGSVGYKLTDQFDVTVGLRRSRETKDINLLATQARAGFTFANVAQWWEASAINGTFATNATQVDSHTWSATTYDVTPRYAITDNLRVYVRYAKGFSSGNYNATAATQNAVGVLDPEDLKSYEIGAKSEWLNNRLQFNAAIFYYDYTNIQQNVMSLDSFGALVNTSKNAGAGYSRGGEIELRAVPVRNLTVGFNLGYANTKFTDFQATPTSNVAGNWFNRVPRLTGNANLDYVHPLTNGSSLSFGTDWAVRTHAYFNAVNQTDPSLIQPGYTVGNASIGYTAPRERFTVRAYSLNVTDKVYKHTQLLGSTASSYAAPRTYGVSVTTQF